MHQLKTSSFQSGSFSRCTEFPCKSDCASIENRGTFTIFSVYPTERVEHAIGPLTSGLRHEHGRRHVGGHVGRSLFLRRHPSFLFSRSLFHVFQFYSYSNFESSHDSDDHLYEPVHEPCETKGGGDGRDCAR